MAALSLPLPVLIPVPCHFPLPKGRPGMSDVSILSGISGLSTDSSLPSPVLMFCLLPLLFWSSLSFFFFLFFFLLPKALMAHSPVFFQKNLQYFAMRHRLLDILLFSGYEMIVGQCYLQYAAIYGTGICHYLFI